MPDPDVPIRATFVRYYVLGALCVATVFAYIDRGCLSVAADQIRKELDLSDAQIGWLHTGFYLTYALLQLPSAWLVERWGVRVALPVFAASWSLATGLGGFAIGFVTLLLSRLLMGVAEAGIFPCTTQSLANWFPKTRRGWTTGILTAFMGIGGWLGSALTGLWIGPLGWRVLFALYAVPGVVWAIAFFLWYRDHPREHSAVNRAEREWIAASTSQPAISEPVATLSWGDVLSNVSVWMLASQQFFRAAGNVFFLTWFPDFLRQTRQVDDRDAGLMSGLPSLALMLGSVSGGWLSDYLLIRTGNRRLARQGLAIAVLLIGAPLILWSGQIAHTWTAIVCMSLAYYIMSLANPVAYATTIDIGGPALPRVFGLMNMTGNLGAMVFPQAVYWTKALRGEWNDVLWLFAGVYVIAAGFWLGLNPTQTVARAHV